uniref:Sorcin-like isoform X2 n=1 Tax=Crassostrea virginica TaxID=6565 RepID=A0A8B8BL52_CRAVI|nr:sorcin-like isoform X2 [Crassostrea virginica]
MAYYQQGYQQHGYQQGGYQQAPGGYQPYQQPQYQQYQQPSQQYGSYGGYFQQNVFSVNAWQAFQFNSQDELWHVYHAEMSKNPANMQRQAIQAEDLCNIMNNCQTIRNYFRINWSRELCSIMIAMLDRSGDGFMQYNEFMELQQCLIAWFRVFQQYDSDRSGFIEANELVNVVTNLYGYRITPQATETILKRYSRVLPRGGTTACLCAFDDFVSVSVRLRAYTDAFRKRDAMMHGQETGNCTFQYDDFLRCVMCL